MEVPDLGLLLRVIRRRTPTLNTGGVYPILEARYRAAITSARGWDMTAVLTIAGGVVFSLIAVIEDVWPAYILAGVEGVLFLYSIRRSRIYYEDANEIEHEAGLAAELEVLKK